MDDGPYPSLAPRAAELKGFEEPDAPPPAPVVADPRLDAEVAGLSARLAKAAGAFATAARAATAAGARARGAAAGSEPWIAAQLALAELDVLRTETSETVTDLDQLAIARATTLAPDYPALETARAEARAEADREAATIARIGAGLAPA